MAHFQNIVVLTGAGISAESGLPTFRDNNGLWEGVDPFEIASDVAYRLSPERVNDFFNMRRQALKNVAPNAAHAALAKLQSTDGFGCYLVTQNIDDLHERGGSRQVHHVHGELLKSRCHLCGTIGFIDQNIDVGDICKSCSHPGRMRPHVVLFGEIPLNFEIAMEKAEKADLFISVGTSGVVYPAANLVNIAKRAGAKTIYLNLEPIQERVFDLQIPGAATATLPDLVGKIIDGSLAF